MSTAHDRRRKAQRAAALLAGAALDEPHLIGRLGEWDLIRKGRVVFAVPVIKDDFPPDLRAAYQRRRAAMLTGTCVCEGRLRPGGPYGLQMDHAAGCIASDGSIAEITARHGGTTIMIPPSAFDD
jgi:hypothetical protein